MFISGLSVSGESSNETANLFCLDMLERWLCGFLPMSQQVIRLLYTRHCRLLSGWLSNVRFRKRI